MGAVNRESGGATRPEIEGSPSNCEEELRLAKATLAAYETGWPPGHFYSPIPCIEAIQQREKEIFEILPELPGIDLNEAGQLALLEQLAPYLGDGDLALDRRDDSRFYLNNPNYVGEGPVYRAILRHLRPDRVTEVGSGFSTALLLDTAERDFETPPAITCIEPDATLLRSVMKTGDSERVRLIETPLQSVDRALFTELEAGDLLFIDSTHVSKIDSDVNHLIFGILPLLQSGVYIHIHDIYYPFEYPKEWILQGRAWNEAYLLRAFLMYNESFRIVLFNDYIHRFHMDRVRALCPDYRYAPGSSLWLEKVDGRVATS